MDGHKDGHEHQGGNIEDQKKFKLIASSRLATCYHPTPEGMSIRTGINRI